MIERVKELYREIVGNSDGYTLETVLSDYDTILWMHGGDESVALREIEYDMRFVMDMRYDGYMVDTMRAMEQYK